MLWETGRKKVAVANGVESNVVMIVVCRPSAFLLSLYSYSYCCQYC